MRERELYRSLGFVRLGDYVVERLGFSYRTAQELMRTDAALENLPLLEAALEAAEITPAHVRLLSRVADPDTEAFWFGLARRMGVKDLARVVAAHLRGERQGRGDGNLRRGDAGASATGGLSGAVEEEEREGVEIFAPAWVAGFWRDSVTGVRRLAGSALPAGACFELGSSQRRRGTWWGTVSRRVPAHCLRSHGPGSPSVRRSSRSRSPRVTCTVLRPPPPRPRPGTPRPRVLLA